ncbi:MAG: hypothetical protein Ta2B_14090 [Termitinemataceae bacterium]|nr:MAG: hypothetical protein Ta2B_14090 [Termitinemataceae bacterium]
MAIEIIRNGTSVMFNVSEKLDASTSHELERNLSSLGRFVNLVVFDFKDLTYISSMGLRAVLLSYKMMEEREGRIVCRNIPDRIHKVFELSGFIDTITRDEKLAIIKRNIVENTAKYALVGELELDKADAFQQEWLAIKANGIKNLDIDCSALLSVSKEAADILTKIRESIIIEKGGFNLENVTDAVSTDIKKYGHTEILERVAEAEATKIKAEAAVIHYRYKTWEPAKIAPMEKNWLLTHDGIKTLVMNFKEAGKIPPEGKKMLTDFKSDMAKKGVEVELEMS